MSKSSNWSSRTVKDKGTGKTVATLRHKTITKAEYSTFKATQAVKRQGTFGAQTTPKATVGGKTVFQAMASATLRKRMAGAKRDALATVGVINPGFTPVTNNKSHLIPDTLGGPSTPNNLINEERTLNLSAHKPIENRIAKSFAAHTPAGDKQPLKRRGSMVVMDEFENDVSMKRTYMVHTDAGNGQPERFDQYTVTRKK